MPIKYVTPPQGKKEKTIGNHRCGEIKIECFGGLTTEEVDSIQEITWKIETPYQKASLLAVTMASREKVKNPKGELRPLTAVEAYEIIAAALNETEQDPEAKNISIKYAQQIAEIGYYNASYRNAKKKATVTAVIQHRNSPDHTYQDTLELDSELVDLIYLETIAEEKEEDNTSDAPPTEEDLGKQPEAKSSEEK
jgi:hypothetical protein